MSTNNLDLFSYLPGLEVSDSELIEAELISHQILRAKYPDLDLREGTALRDLVIRPSATLLALVNKALVFYFQNNTLAEVTDTTPSAFVDKLMSNWFLTRKQGLQAIINARLYFAKQKAVNLYADTFFSPDGTLRYYPTSALSYAATDMTFEPASNQYYLDVDLIAEAASTDYNITVGSLLYFSNFDAYFLHAEINYLRQTASATETNTEFVARSKTAISTRNNINAPSISSNLTDYFTSLTGTKVVGFGDPEMTRDQIKVLVPGVTDPVWIHNGGFADVYCRTPLASSIVQLTTDSSGNVVITGAVYSLQRSLVSGGTFDDTLPQYLTKSVSSITSTGTTATVTCTAHGYATGTSVTIAGAVPTGYNGTFVITSTGANTFTYAVASGLTSPATGTITAGVPVPFTWVNNHLLNYTLSSLTSTSGVATGTLVNHGLDVGDRVTISGATPSAYNGTFLVTGTPTRDTFTYSVSGTPTSPATGTIGVTIVDRMFDVGFSDRQSIKVSFGNTYANQTVSFSLYYFQNIDGYQAYLSDANRRVVCSDSLARGFNLTLLDLVITGYNGPAPDAAVCNTTIEAYLASLAPGQPFVMSDMVSQLNAAGVTTIKTPVGVTYTKYWNDLLGTTTGTITDTWNPGDTLNLFMVNSVVTTNQVLT